MRLVVDVENTVIQRDGKLHLDPFEESNTLVMVGLLTASGEETIVTFDHSETEATPNGHEIVQKALDEFVLITSILKLVASTQDVSIFECASS